MSGMAQPPFGPPAGPPGVPPAGPPVGPPVGPGPPLEPFIVWGAHPILLLALAELFQRDPTANLRLVAGQNGVPERLLVDLPRSTVDELRRLLGPNVRIDEDTTFQIF
jgi:hypothetical protein